MSTFEYWSPRQIVDSGKFPFSMGQIRHLLLHRHRNGLQEAVRKVGKRLLLRVDLFDQWIEAHSQRDL